MEIPWTRNISGYSSIHLHYKKQDLYSRALFSFSGLLSFLVNWRCGVLSKIGEKKSHPVIRWKSGNYKRNSTREFPFHLTLIVSEKNSLKPARLVRRVFQSLSNNDMCHTQYSSLNSNSHSYQSSSLVQSSLFKHSPFIRLSLRRNHPRKIHDKLSLKLFIINYFFPAQILN